jgi:hypothetical protein
MSTKTCSKCNLILPLDNFYRDRTPIHKISYRSKCKICCKEYQKQRKQNTTDNTLTTKICSICNTEKSIDKYYKSYRHKDGYFKWCYECHESKNKNKGNNRHIKRTKEYMIEYNRKRSEDIQYKLRYLIRISINKYIKKNTFTSKQNSSLKYLGCSFEFLKKWFEFNFDTNMSWDNRGLYWHIDHIKPCNSFNLGNQSDIYKCYNWTNLRPLEKKENIIKRDKVDIDIINNFEAKVKEFLIKNNCKVENDIYVLLPEVKALTLINSEEPGELTGNS